MDGGHLPDVILPPGRSMTLAAIDTTEAISSNCSFGKNSSRGGFQSQNVSAENPSMGRSPKLQKTPLWIPPATLVANFADVNQVAKLVVNAGKLLRIRLPCR